MKEDYLKAHSLAMQDALKAMDAKSRTNYHEHGLNQNGSPMVQVESIRNDAVLVVDSVSPDKHKIGEGQLAAMGRMGLDEISHALKAFPDSIPITPEYGALGEPTPQEVFAETHDIDLLSQYQQDIQVPSQEKGLER